MQIVKASRDAGRPLELTIDLIALVEKYLPKCIFQETTIAYIGVSRKCWGQWMRKGRRAMRRLERIGGDLEPSEELFVLLVETVDRCCVKREMDLLELLEEQARGKNKGNAWATAYLLERPAPERYGQHRQEIAQLRKTVKELTDRIAQYAQAQAVRPRITSIDAEVVKPQGTNGVGGNGHKTNGTGPAV